MPLVMYHGKEYEIMRVQPEGVRLKATKNNPLGGFEIVVDSSEINSDINLEENKAQEVLF